MKITTGFLLTTALFALAHSEAISKSQISLSNTDRMEEDGVKLPRSNTLFDIELLTQEEWMREHKRVRTEMGDQAYISKRKDEIQAKTQKNVDFINTHKCNIPRNRRVGSAKWSQEPDRLGTADGREFRIGTAQGVPQHITDGLYELFFSAEDEAYKHTEISEKTDEDSYGKREISREIPRIEVPEEFLAYEIPKWQLEQEEEEMEAKAKEREAEAEERILAGKLSVRDIRLLGECE